jgi:hypothetical protein
MVSEQRNQRREDVRGPERAGELHDPRARGERDHRRERGLGEDQRDEHDRAETETDGDGRGQVAPGASARPIPAGPPAARAALGRRSLGAGGRRFRLDR